MRIRLFFTGFLITLFLAAAFVLFLVVDSRCAAASPRLAEQAIFSYSDNSFTLFGQEFELK